MLGRPPRRTARVRLRRPRSQALPGRPLRRLATTSDEKSGLEVTRNRQSNLMSSRTQGSDPRLAVRRLRISRLRSGRRWCEAEMPNPSWQSTAKGSRRFGEGFSRADNSPWRKDIMRRTGRRQFLRVSGTVMAWPSGFAVGRNHDGKPPRKKRYRVVVIGDTGRGGYGHGLDTAFVGVEGAQIVALDLPHRVRGTGGSERDGGSPRGRTLHSVTWRKTRRKFSPSSFRISSSS